MPYAQRPHDSLDMIAASIRSKLGRFAKKRDVALAINYWIFRHLSLGGPVADDPTELLKNGGGACGSRTILYANLADRLNLKTNIVGLYDFAGGSHSVVIAKVERRWVLLDPLTSGFFTHDLSPAGKLMSLDDVLSSKGETPIQLPHWDGVPYTDIAAGLSPEHSPLPEFYTPKTSIYAPDINNVTNLGFAPRYIDDFCGEVCIQAKLWKGTWEPIDWTPGEVLVPRAGLKFDILANPDGLNDLDPLLGQHFGIWDKLKTRLSFRIGSGGEYWIRCVFTTNMEHEFIFHLKSSSPSGQKCKIVKTKFNTQVLEKIHVRKDGFIHLEPVFDRFEQVKLTQLHIYNFRPVGKLI